MADSTPPPTASPIQSLIDRHRIPVLTEADIEPFCDRHDLVVLFFTGDPARVVESNDVAVALPELIAHFHPRLTAALVDRGSELQLQAAYHFIPLPALVFLRRGRYLGVILRVRTWADYLRETSEILDCEPREPPPFEAPRTCGQVGGMV